MATLAPAITFMLEEGRRGKAQHQLCWPLVRRSKTLPEPRPTSAHFLLAKTGSHGHTQLQQSLGKRVSNWSWKNIIAVLLARKKSRMVVGGELREWGSESRVLVRQLT